MQIDNSKVVTVSATNTFFDKMNIRIFYIKSPNKHELQVFNSALQILDSYIHDFNISIVISEFSILFADQAEIVLTESDIVIGGCVLHLLIYRISDDLSDEALMAIYLEELCHMLFNVTDENEVKELVYRIMNHYNHNYTIEQYMSTIGWQRQV